jgi:hypothetical protein
MMTTGNAILPSVLSVTRDIDRAGFGDGKGVCRRTVFPPGETPRLYGRRVARRYNRKPERGHRQGRRYWRRVP